MRKLLSICTCCLLLFWGQTQQKSASISSKDNTERIESWNNLEQQFTNYNQSNLPKADSILQQLIKLGVNINPTIALRSYELAANYLELQGKIELSHTALKKAVKLKDKIKVKGTKNQNISLIEARILVKDEKYATAKNLLLPLIQPAKKIKDYDQIAQIYTLLGKVNLLDNKPDSCFFYLEKALPYARRGNEKIQLTKVYEIYLRAYEKTKKPNQVLRFALLALEASTKNDLYYSEAIYANKIGTIQQISSNPTEALRYFEYALKKSKQVKSNAIAAEIYTNMGNTLRTMKRYQEALQNHLKAEEIYKQKQNEYGLGVIYTNKGLLYNATLNYEMAISQFQLALNYLSERYQPTELSNTLHHMGVSFLLSNRLSEALPILNRALRLRLKSKNARKYETYAILSEVHSKLENFNKAYEYLSIYQRHKDSIFTSQTNETLAQLSAEYRAEQNFKKIQEQNLKLEQKEKEKAIYNKELEVTELRNNQKTYIIFGILVVVILVSALLFAKNKQARLREQQKKAELNQSLLRSQMNPHFIFNSMSVIQSYIYDNDTKNSSKFLINFSKLMRLILENSPKEFIPIRIEKEILEKYLIAQKLRFEERFNFSIEINQELIDSEALIPPMLTQPFIENAIEHGQLHKIENGTIVIKFVPFNNQLKIEIIDNGIGRNQAIKNKLENKHKSMAMEITKERIDLLNSKYKSDGYMKVEDANSKETKGTHVTLMIPLKYGEERTEIKQ